jgi:hypothetical protein
MRVAAAREAARAKEAKAAATTAKAAAATTTTTPRDANQRVSLKPFEEKIPVSENANAELPEHVLPVLARTGCGPECFNRASFTTCDQRVCPCGAACGNRAFHFLKSPKTKTLLTEHRGWGLFLDEPVTRGAFIVEYTGEIIDDRRTEERLWADKARGEANFYLMEVSHSQIIDARRKGNVSRFINSSCHPNCETQKWRDASTGETRVGIFAIQDIQKGEELTYDYNFAHFGGEGTHSFACMCGHSLCRGTLDANPERTRNYGRRVAIRRGWKKARGAGEKEEKEEEAEKAEKAENSDATVPTASGVFSSGTVLSYHNKTEKYLVSYDDGEKEHVRLDGANAPEHRWLTAPTTKPGEASAAVKKAEADSKKKKERGGKKNTKGRKKNAGEGPKRVRKPDPRRVKAREERAAAVAAALAAATTTTAAETEKKSDEEEIVRDKEKRSIVRA